MANLTNDEPQGTKEALQAVLNPRIEAARKALINHLEQLTETIREAYEAIADGEFPTLEFLGDAHGAEAHYRELRKLARMADCTEALYGNEDYGS